MHSAEHHHTDIDLDPDFADPELQPLAHVEQMDVDTIVVSDIHLGSEVSRGKALVQLLRTHEYKRLILNGDVFDGLNFKRLSRDDWKFLSFIRKLSNPRKNVHVVWVVGNHDGGVSEILSHLLGVPVFEEYTWEMHGKKFLAIHGHQFDKWVTTHPVITSLASGFYYFFQKVDPKHKASRFVKRTSKKFLRMSDRVAHGASRHGRTMHGAVVVLAGHTHHAMDVMHDGVRYVNSGSWTDKPSHFVVVTHDGDVIVHEA
jgi:UDP-2,3-diacylglucosamine pyrophosphatase LpxH